GKESDDDSDEGSDKDSDETVKSGADGDEVRKSGSKSEEEKETSEEEEGSFDLIPRTPEDSEKERDDEEEQESRFSEEARIQEEEDAEELYRDVNINQGRGLQIVSIEPPTPIMTPSTIATITTSGEALIPPPTIPNIILENLPTFNSTFRFEERLRLLETSFSEYRQTNQFADAVSAIPGIVHQYMDQEMKEAVREARSNEQRNLYKALVEAYEAEKTILDTYGDSTIQKRIREYDDQEGPSAGPNRGSKRQKEGAGPTYELMRGSCSSLTELEYHLEEVYKATTDQLDWVN
nr:hypothetical protein [Tanacetum cinerariifolium]